MGFSAFPQQQGVVQLLQRSLERGRLGHAYLFQGSDLTELETMARILAKTLNCEHPPQRAAGGLALDCCEACLNCRKIDAANHPDVLWLRPESKLRIITVDQIRELLKAVYLKPTQARYKLAVIVGADRLKTEAANAFLKTLEEPPADSILVLLTTDPQRVLETIVSRCLRLSFAGEGSELQDAAYVQWLAQFSTLAGTEQKSLLGRYQLLSVLLRKLNELKEAITASQSRQSPLERHEDAEPDLKDKWEQELSAAIESEYRRQRADVLKGVEWWLRDVWLETQQLGNGLLMYPQLGESSRAVARRLAPADAMENVRLLERLQRLLHSNIQEALALEVALLKLKL
jgi:DNA polymerase III subunit delta'